MEAKQLSWTLEEYDLLKELRVQHPTYTTPQIQAVFNSLIGTERARSLDSIGNKLKALKREGSVPITQPPLVSRSSVGDYGSVSNNSQDQVSNHVSGQLAAARAMEAASGGSLQRGQGYGNGTLWPSEIYDKQ